MDLTEKQAAVVGMERGSLFVTGAAGTGKTMALQQRLLRLLAEGEPAYTMMVLVAEPSHRERFTAVLPEGGVAAYADLKVNNYIGLGREYVALFWPLVAREAGFAHAHRPPTWLGYDLAQILMWETVTPMLEAGHFADLRLRPQQIVSQLLDNLNRSALNGYGITAGIERQIRAWAGDAEHIRHLHDARRAAMKFREVCQRNNLLDLSLVVEVFNRHVVSHPQFSRYFSERFRHLLVDNLEEQTAAGQKLVETLLPVAKSAVLGFDTGGGYKTFLAADPTYTARFAALCGEEVSLERRFVDEQGVFHVARQVDRHLLGGETAVDEMQVRGSVLDVVEGRYRREMVMRLGPALHELIYERGIAPREIAIIAPYLDGALRYKLTQSLREFDIPYRLMRRRASPREEPRVRAWMTWLALAHPDWEIYPSLYDMAEALQLSLAGLDPARAMLLAQSLYEPNVPALRDPLELTGAQEARIGERPLAQVTVLRAWLAENGSMGEGETQALDVFMHRLFAEALSQRLFQPEPDVQGAAVCAWLVGTATRLRESAGAMGLDTARKIGRAFVYGIRNGLVTSNPPELGDPPDPEGVGIYTIYSFLLGEAKTEVQVWLETAASGWWDMPRQPLSNTFVLAQSWNPDERWTLEDDVRIRNELLSRVVHGLTSRCGLGVVLATSELDRRGVRQDGPLWRSLRPFLE